MSATRTAGNVRCRWLAAGRAPGRTGVASGLSPHSDGRERRPTQSRLRLTVLAPAHEARRPLRARNQRGLSAGRLDLTLAPLAPLRFDSYTRGRPGFSLGVVMTLLQIRSRRRVEGEFRKDVLSKLPMRLRVPSSSEEVTVTVHPDGLLESLNVVSVTTELASELRRGTEYGLLPTEALQARPTRFPVSLVSYRRKGSDYSEVRSQSGVAATQTRLRRWTVPRVAHLPGKGLSALPDWCSARHSRCRIVISSSFDPGQGCSDASRPQFSAVRGHGPFASSANGTREFPGALD